MINGVVSLLVTFVLRFLFVGLSCTQARQIRFRSSSCCCCIGTIPGGVITIHRIAMGRFKGATDVKGQVSRDESILSPRRRRGDQGIVTGRLSVSRSLLGWKRQDVGVVG